MSIRIRSVIDGIHRPIGLLKNVAVTVVAVLGCAVLLRQLTAAPLVPRADLSPRAVVRPTPAIGSRLLLDGVDWSRRERTIVLVLSTSCHFCTESAPFYRRLASEARLRRGVGLVAVLPQAREQAGLYLEELGVAVDAVVQAPVGSTGARGTPTVMFVDSMGVVARAWIGRLPPESEAQVIDVLKAAPSRTAKES